MSVLGWCWRRFGVAEALMGISAHVWGWRIPLQNLGPPSPTCGLCACAPPWQIQDQPLCLSGVTLVTAASAR